MAWRHYEVRITGQVKLTDEQAFANFETGFVHTGKSRVFAGYFVRVTTTNGTVFLGEDRHSIRAALSRLAGDMFAVNLILPCSGLDPRWLESGLSQNSGWGYFPPHTEAIHMMCPVPAMDEVLTNPDSE